MKYAFFPGCSLESTAWDFDRSTRAVCSALGIELEEIPGWVCCGSTPAHASNASLAVALPVFNLQRARELGTPGVDGLRLVLRPAADGQLQGPQRPQATRSGPSGSPANPTTAASRSTTCSTCWSIIWDWTAIRAAVRRPLAGLRVACYYGCLLTRPPEVVAFDDAEHPTAMDKLVAALGGRAGRLAVQDGVLRGQPFDDPQRRGQPAGPRLVDMARQAGAECIAVACPLCQVNLDLRQADARKAHGELPETPVLYITQLLGLALGLSPKELGLKALSVSSGCVAARTPLSLRERGRG